jgi:hypothetical protein
MTLQEFRAWFEGFTEELRGVPSIKQWERIKTRIEEINGAETTKTVFVEKYWPSYPKDSITWGGNYQGLGYGQIGQNSVSSLSCVAKGEDVGTSSSEIPLASNFSAAESFKMLGCQEFREAQ